MAINFLLGSGERLINAIPFGGGPTDKNDPYTFATSKERLRPRMEKLSEHLRLLPKEVCPDDIVTGLFTIHPAYLAKSYFPSDFLSHSVLKVCGSRERIVTPEVPSSGNAKGTNEAACELFVYGNVSQMALLKETVESWSDGTRQAIDFSKLEDIRPHLSEDKAYFDATDPQTTQWEVLLHTSPVNHQLIHLFAEYVKRCGARADVDRRHHCGELCFLPVFASIDEMKAITQFTMLRFARGMPRMRPIQRSYGSPLTFSCTLPKSPAMDKSIRVAIFDGGPANGLDQWVTNINATGKPTVDEYQEHALAVASTSLFGGIEKGKDLPQPYFDVDVIQVFDKNTMSDDAGAGDYFDVLKRIADTIDSKQYDLINLSIGPDWPVDDNEPHGWTAVLDKKIYKRQSLVFSAVGNTGELDWDSGSARVQPPSDGVNIVGIGSCDSTGSKWKRSPHSSIGFGRRPGVICPELLSMGGSHEHPHFVLGPAHGTAVPVIGTSYAAPNALRVAGGIRAMLGNEFGPLAIKALMINKSEFPESGDMREVGWGRMQHDVERLITSDDKTVHVVYQHQLEPGQCIRAEVPTPENPISGAVYVTWTCCYFTDTDPSHTMNYTRAGLEVVFRPHSKKMGQYIDRETGEKKVSTKAKTKPVVTAKNMYRGHFGSEIRQRMDMHKWETVLHVAEFQCQAANFYEPSFDIHYNAREGGHDASAATAIPFAMVITLRSKTMVNFYNQIFTRYRQRLTPLEPRFKIRLRP